MGIIDVHTHIGCWDQNNDFSITDLLGVLGQNSVDYFVVSHLSGMGLDSSKEGNASYMDEKEANESLLKAFKKYPQALLYATCNPNCGSPDNMRYLLTRKYKNKFVGLKLHTEANQIPANSEIYDGYMKLAKDLDIPCLFHSGDLSSPYSSPELIYELAKRHPETKIILGHLSSGSALSRRRAIEIMKESVETNNSKLYCDISFCSADIIVELVRSLLGNIDRVMFGSDCPMINMRDPQMYAYFANTFVAQPISQVFSDQADKLLYQIFVGNAKKLFKIK